jgi:ABC-2 type transport system permease protein
MSSEFTLRRPGGFLVTVQKVWKVSSVMASNRLAYAGEVLTKVIFLTIILFTIASLWATVGRYHDVHAATGLTLSQMVWYLGFAEVLIMSGPSLPSETLEVDREVRSGDIAYRLVRPLPFALYHLGAYLGFRGVNALLLVAPVCLVATFIAGVPAFSLSAVCAALVAGLVAMIIDGLWTFTLSMCAFWVEDTYGLHLLYRRFLMLLGGLFVPLEGYPHWLRQVAEALPFQALLYGPARLFVSADARALWPLLVQQLKFGAIGLVPLVFLYTRGMRRVAANGG